MEGAETADLLLLSSGAKHGSGFLEHALDAVAELLAGRKNLLFVPYAQRDHDAYTARAAEALVDLDVTVHGLHRCDDPHAALREAEVVFVGGGNSFRLLTALHAQELVGPLRMAVEHGTTYLGASAGTNVACPSLRTSNDMPIVQPRSFAATGLVPFQINPHFLDADPDSTHMGETRERRLLEFLEDNDVPVLGVREGSWVRVRDARAVLGGTTGARLFQRGAEPQEVPPESDVSFLLNAVPRFDTD
ncbi:dipeptidase PepE [Bounagaea algeriensis]